MSRQKFGAPLGRLANMWRRLVPAVGNLADRGESFLVRIGRNVTGRAIRPLPASLKKSQVVDQQRLAKWRRRESNPNGTIPNPLTLQQLTEMAPSLSGYCQEIDGSTWLRRSQIDPQLLLLISRWASLTDSLRQEVLSLVAPENLES